MAFLLPNAKQTFTDGNGVPLAGGSVNFYIPATTTFKQTWKDPLQTIPNTNPVILDGNGSAIIYGLGQYRQQVFDALGNLQWDQLTSDGQPGSIAANPYDLAAFIGGVPASAQLALRYTFVRATAFPANFIGSQSSATIAATAMSVFNIDRALVGSPNTFTTIGTITYAAGAIQGTFLSVSGLAYSFGIGDVIRLVCPAPADVTLASISATITGTR
jgi:hypothetical protein